jgi:hypothetical protein
MSGGAIWLAVVLGALVLWMLPLLIAALLGTEQTGMVVLLVLIAPGTGGITWLASWVWVFGAPRRGPRVPARW